MPPGEGPHGATSRIIGKCLSESECEGLMEVQSVDYPLRCGRKKIIVPEVEVWVCLKCGERVFPYESSRRIEAYKRYSGARKSHRSLNQEITHLLKASLRQTGSDAA
jgi:YgiT-type zinc finger domain-containing protein